MPKNRYTKLLELNGYKDPQQAKATLVALEGFYAQSFTPQKGLDKAYERFHQTPGTSTIRGGRE